MHPGHFQTMEGAVLNKNSPYSRRNHPNQCACGFVKFHRRESVASSQLASDCPFECKASQREIAQKDNPAVTWCGARASIALLEHARVGKIKGRADRVIDQRRDQSKLYCVAHLLLSDKPIIIRTTMNILYCWFVSSTTLVGSRRKEKACLLCLFLSRKNQGKKNGCGGGAFELLIKKFPLCGEAVLFFRLYSPFLPMTHPTTSASMSMSHLTKPWHRLIL